MPQRLAGLAARSRGAREKEEVRTAARARKPTLDIETAVALAATGLLAMSFALITLHVGPLWRDETNAINVAQMASLGEFWHSLRFESFPALWLLLLRLWSFLGLAQSDLGIRCLGFLISLLFLGSLWLCTRWVRGRAPTLSLALLGSLPVFVNIVGANRAYGLAMCLLALSFGAIWRVLESPSRIRIMVAGIVCVLFLQCVYYDAIFLCAMLFGAALVAVRGRKWRLLTALVGIGSVSGASLLICLPVLRSASPYVQMAQVPFSLTGLWFKVSQAVTLQSSAQTPGRPGREVWLWVLLLLFGVAVALRVQLRRLFGQNAETSPQAMADNRQARADLTLFAVVSMTCGTGAYLAFLLRIHFPTQSWYYVPMLSLCAISLEVILGAAAPKLRPWGWVRIGLLVIMTFWGAGSIGEEVHTRRTNVDRIAGFLEKKAEKDDLIVVGSAWEGITFDRYYHGHASWVTLPPINSHKVHRVDLVWEKMNQREAIKPVLDQITAKVQKGNHIWVVGPVQLVSEPQQLPPAPPIPPDPSHPGVVPYLNHWGAQVTAHLSSLHRSGELVAVPVDGPVNWLEDLPVRRF